MRAHSQVIFATRNSIRETKGKEVPNYSPFDFPDAISPELLVGRSKKRLSRLNKPDTLY